jgi:antitoxin component YwqK of YwqJK toxin-antitoxin module
MKLLLLTISFLVLFIMCSCKKNERITSLYPNKKIKNIQYYEKGKITRGIYYYENGDLKGFVRARGTFLIYYLLNSDSTVSGIFKKRNDKTTGVAIIYTTTGKIGSVLNYLDGKLDGLQYHFNDNGSFENREIYSHDTLLKQIPY